jgi:hypothetical protein
VGVRVGSGCGTFGVFAHVCIFVANPTQKFALTLHSLRLLKERVLVSVLRPKFIDKHAIRSSQNFFLIFAFTLYWLILCSFRYSPT